jgi:hypothetical protein
MVSIIGRKVSKSEITQDELFVNLYSTMPKELTFQRELLMSRL